MLEQTLKNLPADVAIFSAAVSDFKIDNFSESKIKKSENIEEPVSDSKSQIGGFLVGLITNVTNIKALLFFVTLFGVILGKETTIINLAIYGVYMAIATFVWFCFVTLSKSNLDLISTLELLFNEAKFFPPE